MRVTNGSTTRQRRNRMKNLAEGTWGANRTSFKNARQIVIRSKTYAFRDRRAKKRDFRSLWIQRINAALQPLNVKYNVFINNLKKAKVGINKKMLSELAVTSPESFKAVVDQVMQK